MPLYEYQCESCGIALRADPEVLGSAARRSARTAAGRLEKLISSPAFQFKGSGCYITDYARKGEKPASDEYRRRTPKDTKDAADKSDKTPSQKADEVRGQRKDSSSTSSPRPIHRAASRRPRTPSEATT